MIPTSAAAVRTCRPRCSGSGRRLVAFDKRLYRQRSIVECLIGWLKESRRIVTRFEKTAINFGGMVTLAFIHRYLRLCDA
jgi:transposase